MKTIFKRMFTIFLYFSVMFPIFTLQLGDGTTVNQLSPKKIMENVIQVCATDFNTFVLKEDGSAWGTGLNKNGILGNQTTKYSNDFVKILVDVKKISASDNTAVFLKKDGTLWLTGIYYNEKTKKSNGNYVASSIAKNTPFLIQNDVIDVLVIKSSVFYIKTDNSLWGFGANTFGEMGLGSTEPEIIPVKIASNVKNFISLTDLAFETLNGAKYRVTLNNTISLINKTIKHISTDLVLYQDNKLFGCGFAAYGALGIGKSKNHIIESETFVMENVLTMESNNYHSLILTKDGKVFSCGGAGGDNNNTYSTFGFIGDGTTIPRFLPVLILENIKYIAIGSYSSFAIDKNGTLYGWGLNNAEEMLLYF